MSKEIKPPSMSIPSNVKGTAKRLPCRGCKATCKNYATCDGKPWRLAR